ncbi:hypothetical protein AVEN_116905-1 [Araneus ventricosus]|uniref:Integrase zinc-binding domain-containing protein n=1 Tax=Araneus ventricosus TaxID=182803 RepID=A0A4Y2UNP0_ARAVE|nr:hypothetical protein AVEN_116905-1 [Araneus ventricosus]
MKALARSFVYWKDIDKDIEDAVRNCVDCARHKTDPAEAKVHYWEYPSEANDHPTPVDFLHRTWMLLAELMFAMCGNANYEPDDDIILESTQIIPQTDEDCLYLVIDEPSWIARSTGKLG